VNRASLYLTASLAFLVLAQSAGSLLTDSIPGLAVFDWIAVVLGLTSLVVLTIAVVAGVRRA